MNQLDRDGVVLHFADVGKGAPPLVLLHGLACDHTFFAPQIEHFRKEHRVVAVDLRGHGKSGKPEQEYTVAVFADDVAWLCYELGVHAPVIVGHGLGGQIGLEVAARFPDLPAAIVAVDALILPPSETCAVLRQYPPHPPGLACHEGLPSPVKEILLSGANLPFKDHLMEMAAAASPQAVVSAWENAFTWDGAAAAIVCEAPLFYIDSGTKSADLQRLGELCQQLTIGRSTGAGHLHGLETPEKVNAMIDRFLDELPT
ncbi:MAG: alpha/beta hydrolase [Chloroflexi bacterium]|nr:alpha/beta hydrolase [Chloroflexota bacterium]MDA8189275.1 alpha/beta hydrolase [Dehalococcoidales bacterium]